jgi:hypothetical protein
MMNSLALASPHAGAKLVAVLVAELVQGQGHVRPVVVGLDHLRGQFLARHAKAEQSSGALGEPHHFRTVGIESTAPPPEIGILRQAQLDFAEAGVFHFLAHDALDAPLRAQAQRQPRVESCRVLVNEARLAGKIDQFELGVVLLEETIGKELL